MDKKDILEMIQELNEKQTETICIEVKTANQGKPENIMILYQVLQILWVESYYLELKKKR